MKTTGLKYSEVLDALYANIDQLGHNCPIISDNIYNYVQKNKEFIAK